MKDKQWDQFRLLVRVTLYPVIILVVVWGAANIYRKAIVDPANKEFEQSQERLREAERGRLESISQITD